MASRITALALLIGMALVVVAVAQVRAAYTTNLRLFASASLDQSAFEAARSAVRIQAVLPNLLLRRRIPSSTRPEDAQTLRDALGPQPPTIDALAVRLPSGERIVPLGWSNHPAPHRGACAEPWRERSLWLARYLLWVDLCAEIGEAVRLHPMASTSIVAPYLMIVQPLPGAEGADAAFLETRHSIAPVLDRWAAQSHSYLLWLALHLLIIMVLTAGGWLLVLRRIRLVHHTLNAATEREALWVPGRATRTLDEIGRLEHAMRRALRGAAVHQRRLQHKNDILERLRRFIAHEIRNPLQSLMAINAQSPEALSYLRRIKYAVDEVLEDAAAEDTRDIEERDLSTFVHRWVDSLKAHRGEQLIAFTRPATPCMVRLNFEALEDALDHIYSNANDFRLTGSYIEIRVGATATHGTITVRNLGPQIPEHMLPLIFNYGVTTRAHHAQHLGQGLFRANSLVARMNGSLRVQNVPDGVEFTITVPLLGAVTL